MLSPRAVSAQDADEKNLGILSTLNSLPWFAGLPADLLTHIARHGVEARLRDQQLLFVKDEPEHCLALVLSGRIYHVLHNQDGRELIIDRSEPGDWVGESALLDRKSVV